MVALQGVLLNLLCPVSLTLLTYLVSYQRHRALSVEGMVGRKRHRRLGSALLDSLVPNPRQQAVIGFMMQTLARSSHHRMVLMGYSGLLFAVLVTGLIGMASIVGPARVAGLHSLLLA